MSAVATTPGPCGPVPFALDGSDRLGTLFAPIRGMSRAMLAVLVGSAALHLVIVATAIVTSRAPLTTPPTVETTVEVVQEMPKPAPKPAPVAKVQAPKTETPRVQAAQVQASQVQASQVQAPKAETPPKAEAKTETTKTETTKTETTKTPAPTIVPQSRAAKPEATKADEREALMKELADLRAQRSQLKASEATETPASDPGMGPLPGSFQAVALPSSGQGVGEAMGYQDIVFSQLAKAKGLGRRQGQPGTTGVRFDVDAAGGLVDVEIVHPSGVAALDAEALDIVRRAAPFPAPPPGARRNFTANVNFVVQGQP